jgi:hypothetical protein
MKFMSQFRVFKLSACAGGLACALALSTSLVGPAMAAAGKAASPSKANQAASSGKEVPPPFVVLQVDSGKVTVDTLQLPDQVARPGQGDSLSKEFAKYWAQLEKQEGMAELKKQMQANDIDRTKIPHLYLADSNLVIFPGWFILRKKP